MHLMKVSILGTNGFLSSGIAHYCNGRGIRDSLVINSLQRKEAA